MYIHNIILYMHVYLDIVIVFGNQTALMALCHDISSDCLYLLDLVYGEPQTNDVSSHTRAELENINLEGQSKDYSSNARVDDQLVPLELLSIVAAALCLRAKGKAVL